jgi:hypothetical protein
MPQRERVDPSRTDAADKKLADDIARESNWGDRDPRYLKAKAIGAGMGIRDPERPPLKRDITLPLEGKRDPLLPPLAAKPVTKPVTKPRSLAGGRR